VAGPAAAAFLAEWTLLLVAVVAFAAAGDSTAVGRSAPAAPIAEPVAGAFLWPLPETVPSLTGTFMEFRQGRYHSGIDLRTRGREGLRVLAPASGSITRVRCSATGYGVAVYLTLPDGRQLVFAHLSALADRLRAPLVSAWKRSGRYRQDLRIPPGRLQVERGELLALSGSTGVGAPHLHLELRDASERPLNPLLHGFSVADTLRPRITGLRLVPLSARSRLDGRPFPRTVHGGDRVEVAGPVGLMVRVDDRSDAGAFRLAPLGIAVRLDGHEIGRLENLTFDFAQSRQMRLERADDPQPLERPWLRLYHRPGNRLPGRIFPQGDGSFEIDEGRSAELEVTAWDAAGNRGTARLLLQGGAVGRDGPDRAFAGESPFWPKARANPLSRGGRISAAVGEAFTVEVENPEDACYRGGVLWWESAGEGLEAPPRARVVLSCGRLRSAGAVFDRGVVVRVGSEEPLEATAPVGLFLLDERGEWSFLAGLAGEAEGGRSLRWEGRVDRPGAVLLLADEDPPRLGPFRSQGRILHDGDVLEAEERPSPQGLRLPRWPAVRVGVSEDVAGIEEDDILAEVDGHRWPARYDPEARELVFEFWIEPAAGEHLFTVDVRDRLGQESHARLRLILRP